MQARFTTTISNFGSSLWSFHIPVPLEIAKNFLEKDAKRVVCNLEGIHSYQCAIMPYGNDYYFLLLNKPTIKKFKLSEGQTIQVTITKDESEYGLPMPEEMEIMLKEDPDFNYYFHNLTPGKQRNILYLVGQPKTSNTRIRKLMVVVEHLKANKGKLDFKLLYDALKIGN